MIPCQITLRNFMCYRNNGDDDDTPLSLNLDGLHVVCLSGENGAGKSALLDAITWALWGKARMGDEDLIAQGETEMQVELVFQLGPQTYRVIRSRQRSRSGRSSGKGAIDFQVQTDKGWRALSENTASETQRQINGVLRMSYDTFINASFLLQGRADEFTRKTAAERKQVLADILDLHEYAVLEECAKQRAKRLDGEMKGLDGVIEHLAGEAEKLAFYSELVTEGEQRVAAQTKAWEQATEAQRLADERVRELEQKAAQHRALAERLAGLRNEQRDEEQAVTTIQREIGQAEALIGRKNAITAGMDALQAARNEQNRLEGLRDQFDELEQQRQEHQAALKDILADLRQQQQQASTTVEQLANKAERHTQLSTEIAALQQQIAVLAPYIEEREQLEHERSANEQREQALNALHLRREKLQAAIKLRQDSLVAAREEQHRNLKRLDQQLAQVASWQATLEAARQQQALLQADEQQLAVLRQNEQQGIDHVSSLRAECKQLKAQADALKERRTLIEPDAAICPLCQTELGHDGAARVQEHYDAELQTLRTHYSEGKREADAEEQRLQQVRDDRTAREAQVAERQRQVAAIASLETQLAQAAQWQIERAQAHERNADLQQQLDAKDYESEAQAELAALETDLAASGDLATLQDQRRDLQRRVRELDKQLNEQSKLQGSLAAQQHEQERLATDLIVRPAADKRLTLISKQLDENDFGHDIRKAGKAVVAAIAQLGYSAERYAGVRSEVQALAHWEAEERQLTAALIQIESQRQVLAQHTATLARRAAEIERGAGDEAVLSQEVRLLPAAQQTARQCAATTTEQRRHLDVATRDLFEKQAQHKRAQEASQSLAAKQAEHQQLAERKGVFQELAEAFGKKGVQAMLIETAIPQIEDEANRLLNRMTDNQMHLAFEMQRDTKKGDTVETLEIKIADTLGTRIYDAFSGGEAMRANFAVRVALSRLLARRAGASLETLVIDEGFGTLDAMGRERMVEAITSVQHDFRRIVVITHIDELKDRFPAQIEVTKTPQGSRWELR